MPAAGQGAVHVLLLAAAVLRVRVRACVRACVYACVRVCVRVCLCRLWHHG